MLEVLAEGTRARVTKAMDLLRLAPDIQEAVLHLPPVNRARGPKHERALRGIAGEPLWAVQRATWEATLGRGDAS